MEANVSGFTFFSTFDSGNLASVEAIPSESHPLNGLPEINDELPAEKGGPLSPADYSFRIWTRPDCAGMYFTCSYHDVIEALTIDSEGLNTPIIKTDRLKLNGQTKMKDLCYFDPFHFQNPRGIFL